MIVIVDAYPSKIVGTVEALETMYLRSPFYWGILLLKSFFAQITANLILKVAESAFQYTSFKSIQTQNCANKKVFAANFR